MTRRQLAEQCARWSGDVSEEGVQKQLKFLAQVESERSWTPKERRASTITLALAYGGIACAVVGSFFLANQVVSRFGMVVAFVGFVFGIVVEGKRDKRLKNLPPSPIPKI